MECEKCNHDPTTTIILYLKTIMRKQGFFCNFPILNRGSSIRIVPDVIDAKRHRIAGQEYSSGSANLLIFFETAR